VGFPFDPSNMGSLMAGFQQQVQRLKDEAAAEQVTGRAGAGAVEVDANGALEVLAVRISPAAFEDRELLEDLLVAATNDALKRAQGLMAGKLGALAGGLGLPPGLL
jgi:nucleoid-associated protein EbfC